MYISTSLVSGEEHLSCLVNISTNLDLRIQGNWNYKGRTEQNFLINAMS